jgi:hypothetical protein
VSLIRSLPSHTLPHQANTWASSLTDQTSEDPHHHVDSMTDATTTDEEAAEAAVDTEVDSTDTMTDAAEVAHLATMTETDGEVVVDTAVVTMTDVAIEIMTTDEEVTLLLQDTTTEIENLDAKDTMIDMLLLKLLLWPLQLRMKIDMLLEGTIPLDEVKGEVFFLFGQDMEIQRTPLETEI